MQSAYVALDIHRLETELALARQHPLPGVAQTVASVEAVLSAEWATESDRRQRAVALRDAEKRAALDAAFYQDVAAFQRRGSAEQGPPPAPVTTDEAVALAAVAISPTNDERTALAQFLQE